ncbi:MAG: HIT family protein [Sulfuricella sp.]
MNINRCEFCAEIDGADSRFHDHYSGILDSRVVLEKSGFLVMPSMGQITPGSLMVMPREHVERFADLPVRDRLAAETLIGEIVRASPGEIAVFEHGARSCTGGSCGIYHAHIHIIPLADNLCAAHLSEGLCQQDAKLESAWTTLAVVDEYLLLSDGRGRAWTREVKPTERELFPSQYFRRVLAGACGKDNGWDWKTVAQPESELVDSFNNWSARLQVLPARMILAC